MAENHITPEMLRETERLYVEILSNGLRVMDKAREDVDRVYLEEFTKIDPDAHLGAVEKASLADEDFQRREDEEWQLGGANEEDA